MKMTWYSTCLLLLFLFRTNGKKGDLDENDFRHGYGIFFESGILKVTWWQLSSKSLLNNYEAHWQQHFERCPTVYILRTRINLRAKSFIKTSVNVTETIFDECGWKKISCVKIQEHGTKIETTFHLFYTLIFVANFIFRFNIVLIGIIFIFNIVLIGIFLIISTTSYLLFRLLINIWLKSIQRLYTFL